MKIRTTIIVSGLIGISSFIWLCFIDWKIAIGVLGMCCANNLLKVVLK